MPSAEQMRDAERALTLTELTRKVEILHDEIAAQRLLSIGLCAVFLCLIAARYWDRKHGLAAT